jgi:hypothetical protein
VLKALDFLFPYHQDSSPYNQMDMILGHRPQSRFAILEMDKNVLDLARTAIVCCYREQGLLSTTLDIGSLAGIRALTYPFDLAHITRAVVRSLVAEGFNAHWDKTTLNGSGSLYVVHVSWRVALNYAQRARRKARERQKQRVKTHKVPTDEMAHDSNCTSPGYAPSITWIDDVDPVLDLDMLANPDKLLKSDGLHDIPFPR